MKVIKKIVVLLTVIGLLGATGVVYAATAQSPADIAAGLTGKSVENLYQERAAGKTFGAMASEAGKLEEFKTQMLAQKKVLLNQRVQEGKITPEQADKILSTMENNQALCDGTGMRGNGVGRQNCAGFGQGMGRGMGCGGIGQGQNGAGFGRTLK